MAGYILKNHFANSDRAEKNSQPIFNASAFCSKRNPKIKTSRNQQSLAIYSAPALVLAGRSVLTTGPW